MLIIDSNHYQAVIDHCLSHYGSERKIEACGFLAGKNGRVQKVYPMTNVDQSPISYAMDPKEQMQVMRQMREAGEEMLAIYHSHTATEAYPSPVDVKLAVYPEVSYVLVSLKDPENPVMRSFRILNNTIEEEALEVQ